MNDSFYLLAALAVVTGVAIGLLLIRDLLSGKRPFPPKLRQLCRQARQLIVQNKRLLGASLFLSVLITTVSYFSAGESLGPVIYKSQTGGGFPFAYLVTSPSGFTTTLFWSYLLLDLVIWFIVSIILLMGTKRLLLSYLIEK